MYGKKVRIVGGGLDGYERRLLYVKEMRKRCLIEGLSEFISAVAVGTRIYPNYQLICGKRVATLKKTERYMESIRAYSHYLTMKGADHRADND